MSRRMPRVASVAPLLLSTLLFSIAAPAEQPVYVNAQLPLHPVVLDQQGKLLAWYQPDKGLGYDQVVRLGWDFINNKVPNDTRGGTGLKIYLVNSVFDGETLQGTNWQHNPAMVFASFVDSLVAWYAYSGDAKAIETVREMLDHHLAHGTTPADWAWPQVPFGTSCGEARDYGRCVQNLPRAFYGGIETDKVAELGTGYALFYKLTGEKKYLDAAIRCAEALAKYVREGNAERTPWPFRVDAQSGTTLSGEEYGGNVSASLRLFEELIRINAGDVAGYQRASDIAWRWLVDFPLNRKSKAWNKWSGYFEDVPRDTDNVNQLLPMAVSYYILAREDPSSVDPLWKDHVAHLLDWVREKMAHGPYYGAHAIDEQGSPTGSVGCCSRAGVADHTARWAAINAMYFERTRDGQAREDAFRSLNYATYFAGADGRIVCCGSDYKWPYWFSDGYSDYMRHFFWAMAAIPEFAPRGKDHVLRSSSVVQKVTYAAGRVQYKTFDTAATEVLRLGFKPSRVTEGTAPLRQVSALDQPGYVVESLPGGDWVVRIRHAASGDITVQR